jgi:hypothetical protein
MQTKFRINTPHIVHDTLEGETILINLKNGNYYSFDKTGAVIWEIIDKKGDLNKFVEIITGVFKETKDKTESCVDGFISNLLMENLLVQETENINSPSLINSEEMEKLVRERIPGIEVPVVNKYSDMKDILMLDPIHDIDEKGWPTINEE